MGPRPERDGLLGRAVRPKKKTVPFSERRGSLGEGDSVLSPLWVRPKRRLSPSPSAEDPLRAGDTVLAWFPDSKPATSGPPEEQCPLYLGQDPSFLSRGHCRSCQWDPGWILSRKGTVFLGERTPKKKTVPISERAVRLKKKTVPFSERRDVSLGEGDTVLSRLWEAGASGELSTPWGGRLTRDSQLGILVGGCRPRLREPSRGRRFRD